MTQGRRTPVSAVIITLNEEDHIADCLRSLAWADECVVVDSGSQDATCEIARSLGARVIAHAWEGFGRQKQFATEQARFDWVINIDADERVSPELARAIGRALASPPSVAAYRCNFRHRIMGRWLRHGEAWPDPHVRLYDRRRAAWNARDIHEAVEVDGEIGRLEGCIEHCTADSIAEIFDKINRYTDIQARQLVEAGRPIGLSQVLGRPLWRFWRNYVLRLGMLDGLPGLVHAVQAAMTSFLKYAKAAEMQHHRQ